MANILPTKEEFEDRVKSASDFWDTHIKPKMITVAEGTKKQCMHWHILFNLFDTDAEIETTQG